MATRRLCEADLVERISAVTLLDRLHEAQNQFYGGGDGAALTELLTSDVAWSVPGNNRIAGSYHGLAEVFAYFRHRRDLAGATFRMHRKDILVGEGRRLAALTDGTATLAGRARQWSTVGLYDVTEQGRIAACCSRLSRASSTRSGQAAAAAVMPGWGYEFGACLSGAVFVERVDR